MPQEQDNTPQEPQDNVDYEARYKGQVKAYNTLRQQYDAKEAAHQQAIEQLSNVRSSSQEALIQAQNEAAQAKLQLTQHQTKLTDFETQLALAKQEADALKGRDAVRKKLVAKKADDILPFFEEGFFSLENLDDAVVDQKIQSFRDRLGSVSGKEYSGVVPPAATPVSTSGGAQQVGDADKLLDWLNDPANLRDPKYGERLEQFYILQEKSNK